MAPRDDDKAMDGLLRRTLARDAARGAARDLNCPEPDILAAYSEQSLDANETAHYELHFSTCPKCREQLAAIFRTQSVKDVPAEMEMLAHAAGPRAAISAAPPAAAPAATKSTPPLRSWALHLRWAAPVAAVFVLVAVVSWQRTARVAHIPASENQVAMNKPESVPNSLADQSSRQYDVVPPTAPSADLKKQTPQRDRLEADKGPAATKSEQTGALIAGNRARIAPNKLQSNSRADLDAAYSQNERADGLRAKDQMQRKVESRRTSDDTSASLEKSAREQAPPPTKAPAPAQTVNSVNETPGATTSTIEVQSAASAVAVPAPPPPSPQPKPEAAPAGAPSMTTTESVRTGKLSKEKKDTPQAAGAVAGAAGGGVGAGIGGYANSKSAVVDVRSGAAPVIQSQDANVQYRIAGGARIERSDDSGATWQGQRMKVAAQILAGAVPSENVCWLVGRFGAILLTTDGKSWKKISPPEDADFVAVTASDASSAAVTSADGRTFRTTDGGRSWQLAK